MSYSENDSLTSLDLVVPVFNEEEVLKYLFERLSSVFSAENLKRHRIGNFRVLFVDDGSKDKSSQIIASRIEEGFPGVLFRFARNFGHQAAVSAGLAYSSADLVAVIDSDLQDPPEVVLEMIGVWRNGFDVVYGRRRKRKENWVKRLCYWSYYRLLSFLSEVDVAMDSGDFCLMDCKVVRAINSLPERLRFPRGLRSWVGFRQTALDYERPGREAGASKYSFAKLYKLATHGIAAMSIRPLRITQYLASIFILLAGAFSVLSFQKYLSATPSDELSLWFFMTFLLVSGSTALVLFCLYVMSSYLGRVYLEVKGRPQFLIMEIIGGEKKLNEK